MARTPDADVPRDRRISVRVTAAEAADVDRLRGTRSQADYVRDLIVKDGKRRRLARGHALSGEEQK